MRIVHPIACLVLCLLTQAGAEVAKPAPYRLHGVAFAPSTTVCNTTMQLHGAGLFRRFLWRVYVGALYLPEGIRPEEALTSVSKRIEIQYLRDLPGRILANETEKGIEANVSARTLAGMRKDLGRLHDLFTNATAGDRCAITYIAGEGTYLEYNGAVTAFFENPEFAYALFSVWLGEAPIDKRFKQSILTPVGE